VRKIKESIKLIIHRPKLALDFDYDKYWVDKRGDVMGAITPFQQNRANAVLSLLGGDGRALDIGSGDGGIINYLRSRSELVITASDISELALQKLRSRNFDVLRLDVENIPEDLIRQSDFKYIFAFEVLEHVKDSETLLSTLCDLSETVIFSIPNTGYFAHRLRLLFGKFPLQWRLSPSEHLRFWTLSDLKWWLESLGYKDAEILTYEGIPFLNKLFPSLFSMGIVAKVTK